MSEMVERVAAAIHKVNVDSVGLKFSELVLEMARAAIGEMRNPTDAMLGVGPGEPYMDDHVWAKMIDEALNDGA